MSHCLLSGHSDCAQGVIQPTLALSQQQNSTPSTTISSPHTLFLIFDTYFPPLLSCSLHKTRLVSNLSPFSLPPHFFLQALSIQGRGTSEMEGEQARCVGLHMQKASCQFTVCSAVVVCCGPHTGKPQQTDSLTELFLVSTEASRLYPSHAKLALFFSPGQDILCVSSVCRLFVKGCADAVTCSCLDVFFVHTKVRLPKPSPHTSMHRMHIYLKTRACIQTQTLNHILSCLRGCTHTNTHTHTHTHKETHTSRHTQPLFPSLTSFIFHMQISL